MGLFELFLRFLCSKYLFGDEGDVENELTVFRNFQDLLLKHICQGLFYRLACDCLLVIEDCDLISKILKQKRS